MPDDGQSRTILVVDDDESVLHVVVLSLRKAGYTVMPATTSEDALKICSQCRDGIDLAILDVVMPTMSGPELLDCLQKHSGNVRTLFISGYPKDEAIRRTRTIPSKAEFLQKPFTPAVLRARVSDVLAQPI